MSQELFEKYLQDRLTEPEQRRLSDLLSTLEGSRAFAEFVREWSLLAEVSRSLHAHPVEASTSRIRRVTVPGRAGTVGWLAGLAAAILLLLGLVLSTGPGREKSSTAAPVAERKVGRPVPSPEPQPELPPKRGDLPEASVPPRPEPVPAPVPEAPVPAPRPDPVPSPVPAPALRRTDPPAPPSQPEKLTLAALASIERTLGTVTILTREGPRAASDGQEILAEQGLQTPARSGFASVRFPDQTRLDLGPDSVIERISEPRGKSLLLSRGTLAATVTRQPAGKPMTIRTPHAEATVLGTQLTLVVTVDATRLEVREGKVRLSRLSDGAAVEVAAGHMAFASKGAKPESRVLVVAADFQDGVAPAPGYAGTRDASLSGADPARNFGASDPIEADGDEVEGKKIYALLKWDVSDLPPASTVRSVVVTLNITDISLGTGYHLYEMKRPWVEGEAHWRAFAAGREWKLPGARSPQDRGVEVVGTVAPREKGIVTILLNPVGEALVQSWIRNPASNHGILIANDTVADGFKFNTRESAVPERRPKLTVTFTPPAK